MALVCPIFFCLLPDTEETPYVLLDDSGNMLLDGSGSALVTQGGDGGGGGADDDGLLTVTVPISSAELKALHATPKELIDVPGDGKVIFPLWGACLHHFVSTPYTISGDDVDAEMGFHDIGISGDGQSIDGNLLTFLDGDDADRLAPQLFIQLGTAANTTIPDNAAVELRQQSGSAYIDGDGSVDVTLIYLIIE